MDALVTMNEEALVEPAFRRLLSAVESEKSRVRNEHRRVDEERITTEREQEKKKADTETWCTEQKAMHAAGWAYLDNIHEKMSELIIKGSDPLLDIKMVDGGEIYTLPSSLLQFQDSLLQKMFIGIDGGDQLPKDREGFILCDLHPECFQILVEFLQTNRLSQKCPTPIIPPHLWKPMEEMLDALNITAFARQNRLSRFTHTSLKVSRAEQVTDDGKRFIDRIESMYDGWQVVTAEDPVSTSKDSYFVVTVKKNANPKGGLALGLVGHVPVGDEVHGLFFEDGVLYNSSNGLMGAGCSMTEVKQNIQFEQGAEVGVHYEPLHGTVTWYVKHPKGPDDIRDTVFESMGKAVLRQGLSDTIYPAFAVYEKGMILQVNFEATVPGGVKMPTRRPDPSAGAGVGNLDPPAASGPPPPSN